MTRMSREFSLILLGSAALTAGYFLTMETADDLQAAEDQQTRQAVSSSRTGYYHGPLFFFHSSSYGGKSMASGSSVARFGGFGGIGHASAGG